MLLQEVLVIIKPISTYDMTILATKITQIGQLRPKLWYFFTLPRVNNFSPSSFWWLFNVFTPNVQPSTFLVIIKPICIYEMTILAKKNHSNWCNEAWNMTLYISHRVHKFSPCSFWWLINVFTSLVQSQQFLWLKWSFYMCWFILWWPEMCWAVYWG